MSGASMFQGLRASLPAVPGAKSPNAIEVLERVSRVTECAIVPINSSYRFAAGVPIRRILVDLVVRDLVQVQITDDVLFRPGRVDHYLPAFTAEDAQHLHNVAPGLA